MDNIALYLGAGGAGMLFALKAVSLIRGSIVGRGTAPAEAPTTSLNHITELLNRMLRHQKGDEALMQKSIGALNTMAVNQEAIVAKIGLHNDSVREMLRKLDDVLGQLRVNEVNLNNTYDGVKSILAGVGK